MKRRSLKVFLLIALCSLFIDGNSQSQEVIINHGIKEAYSTSRLYVYGLDFSEFKLVNKDKLHAGYEIKTTCAPIWITNFENVYSEKRLSSHIKIDTLCYLTDNFQEKQLQKLDESKTVVSTSKSLNVEQIEYAVRNYELNEQEGIGFSIIVEEFYKKKEVVSLLFVYFDIGTRELLYVFREFGVASGMGMRNHWENGMQDCIDTYFNYRYKKEWRKIRKQ